MIEYVFDWGEIAVLLPFLLGWFQTALDQIMDNSNIPDNKYDLSTFSCLHAQWFPHMRFFASFCPSVNVLYSTFSSHSITCSTLGTRLRMDFTPPSQIWTTQRKHSFIDSSSLLTLLYMQGSLPVIDNRAIFICIASQFIMSPFKVYTGTLSEQPC